MIAKRATPARRALQILVVFILSALIARTSFATSSTVKSSNILAIQKCER